ncbi:MAG: PilN domain-containing protein [Candidatus Magasanikbacteria bacterium]|nr:PilN domain-containing protein [Candidatus Magasanikbacteria bacterium]
MNSLLNLLPPAKIKIVKNLYLLYFSRFLIEILFIYGVMIAIILILAQHLLNSNLQIFEEKTLSIKREYQTINKQIEKINRDLAQINLAQSGRRDWARWLADLAARREEGVFLSALEIQKDNKILLQGRASSREKLLNYQKKLEESGLLTNAQIPISFLTAKENIDFTLSADLNLK